MAVDRQYWGIFLRDFAENLLGNTGLQLVCKSIWPGAFRRHARPAFLAAGYLSLSARRLDHLAHPHEHVHVVHVRTRVGARVGAHSLSPVLLSHGSRSRSHQRHREYRSDVLGTSAL